MRRLIALWSLSIIVAAATAVAASYASATTMTLPNFSTNTTFTGTSGADTVTFSGFTFTCKKDLDEGTMETGNRLGLFTIDFQECETSLTTEPFHSLGGSTNNLILASGSWHLVLRLVSNVDQRLFLFLLNPLHIECGTVLISMRGDVLGTAKEKNELEFEITVNSTGTAQEITSFENDNGTLVETNLEVAVNLGFHIAGWNAGTESIFTKTKAKLEN